MADADIVDIRSDGFIAIASGVLSGGRRVAGVGGGGRGVVPVEGTRANDDVDLPRRPDTEGSILRGGGGRGRGRDETLPPATEGSGGPGRG